MRTFLIACMIVGITTSVVGVADLYSSSMQRLYSKLFTPYRKAVRPVLNDTHALELRVQFWFKQLLRVSESDQILTIYCWLEMYWRDEYLTWSPNEYDGITRLHVPVDHLWQPDILVYNKRVLIFGVSANMNVEENELATNAIVSSDGNVTLFRSIITDVTCNLDLTYFPFDQQACYIMLSSWSYDGGKLQLREYAQSTNHTQFYIRNNEWRMEEFKVRRNVKMYNCCDVAFPDVAYYFVLSRNPAYYILTLIIPSGFITVVTIIGFFTPSSSTGENTEKVSLGVTALLSMAIIMMMVADEIPATSDVMPLIGKYYIGLICILFLAATSTTMTLSIQMRGINGDPPCRLTKLIFLRWLPRIPIISMFLCEAPDHGGMDVTEMYRKLFGVRPLPQPRRFEWLSPPDRRTTSREWRQVTRVIERMLMLVFISLVVLFAYVMLVNNEADKLYLTDERMDTMTSIRATL